MTDTVFVPCPAGNNPETFRHYEALEVGSIPLIMRPSDMEDHVTGGGARPASFDFLQFWEGYPGPILDSWAEAEGVMKALETVPGDLDKLQRRIQVWYASFKALTRQRVATIMHGHMDVQPRVRHSPSCH